MSYELDAVRLFFSGYAQMTLPLNTHDTSVRDVAHQEMTRIMSRYIALCDPIPFKLEQMPLYTREKVEATDVIFIGDIDLNTGCMYIIQPSQTALPCKLLSHRLFIAWRLTLSDATINISNVFEGLDKYSLIG